MLRTLIAAILATAAPAQGALVQSELAPNDWTTTPEPLVTHAWTDFTVDFQSGSVAPLRGFEQRRIVMTDTRVTNAFLNTARQVWPVLNPGVPNLLGVPSALARAE